MAILAIGNANVDNGCHYGEPIWGGMHVLQTALVYPGLEIAHKVMMKLSVYYEHMKLFY
jgi:hypothetical protein